MASQDIRRGSPYIQNIWSWLSRKILLQQVFPTQKYRFSINIEYADIYIYIYILFGIVIPWEREVHDMRFGNPRSLHLQREMTISWSFRYLHARVRIHTIYGISLRARIKEKRQFGTPSKVAEPFHYPQVLYNHSDVVICTQTQLAPLCVSFDNVSRPFGRLRLAQYSSRCDYPPTPPPTKKGD